MDIDLLFIAVTTEEWRNISDVGKLKPADGETSIRSFQGNDVEKIINKMYEQESELLLLILDPLRLQTPIKHNKEDGLSFVDIQGDIPLDTIIDKLKLKKGKDDSFSVNVKHFD